MPRITPHRPPRHFARAHPRPPSRTDRAYDAGARLTEVANTAANGEQVGVRYTLAADDQRIEALEVQSGGGPTSPPTGQKWQYGYDGLKQLVTAKFRGRSPTRPHAAGGADQTDTATSVVPPLDQSYSYDPMGNRRAYTEQGKSVAYASNSANQYVSISETSAGSPVQNSPVYDRNGNMLTDGLRTYTWDAENQLVAVTPVNPTEGSQRVEYTYDWRMRRKDKKSFVFANGAWALARTHTFKYHEWNPIEETIAEFTTPESRASNLASRTSAKRYVWGNDLSGNLHGAGGVGGLLSMKVSSFSPETSNLKPETYFYAYDGNGNVRALVKADATNPSASGVVEKYAYDGFGRELPSSTPIANRLSPFAFSTKYLDAEAGMNYYGYRYYVAESGRWINRDPIVERGGVGIYCFCGNSTQSGFDVLGLFLPDMHKKFTQHSFDVIWNELGLAKKAYASRVRDAIAEASEGFDGKYSTNADLPMHYNFWNRQRDGYVMAKEIEDAKNTYGKLIKEREAGAYSMINNPSSDSCSKALVEIGELAHMWQDYYAHALNTPRIERVQVWDTHFNTPSWVNRRVWDAPLTGSPEKQSEDFYPSGYDVQSKTLFFFWDVNIPVPGTSEYDHGVALFQFALEPYEIYTSDVSRQRENSAKGYVTGKFRYLLQAWNEKCACK